MEQFVTDVFLVSSKDSNMSRIILDTTINGGDGNLYESSWRNKGKRLIGFSRNVQDAYVVTDITVIPEDQDIPDDYAGCLITVNSNEKGLKKHILCYERNPRNSSENAITEIIIVGKDEQIPPYFTAVGEKLNDIKICFKKEPIPKPKPLPRIPTRQAQEQKQQQQQQHAQSSHKSPASGIEGVPFQINPKFNTMSANTDPLIARISKISIDDLLQKYQYSFDKEKEVINAT